MVTSESILSKSEEDPLGATCMRQQVWDFEGVWWSVQLEEHVQDRLDVQHATSILATCRISHGKNASRDAIVGMYALVKCYLLSVLRDALSMLTASMSPQPLQ